MSERDDSASADSEEVLEKVEYVMARLQCSRTFISEAVARGELPAYRLGRHLRFSRTDVDAYVERLRA
ncbi:helix-turn-helix domain-containing protein [Microbacterium jiangjiandongii]|uniref:helix-turn-helix domain-containing protein n=1 Tax=Microbacterium jiangjiandongii TaxID=3049071 RepID=UPI00214CCE68|nr:helix-turn-helix domain-containing protein [Microbacterium sp. zg.Y843]MCR2814466.1 helix-turn-helix domain-containing protein [Microbacterium sp. zg.Y843]